MVALPASNQSGDWSLGARAEVAVCGIERVVFDRELWACTVGLGVPVVILWHTVI